MDESLANYKKLQKMVDYLCHKIESRCIDSETARKAESQIRETASEYFPDRAELYEMVYASRFRRLIEQYLATE